MLLWFRNDLRLDDNPALEYVLANKSDETEVNALFFISKAQWQQHHWSAIKIDFICRHAYDLVERLTPLGIKLNIVEVDRFDDQIAYLVSYCQQYK